VNSVKPVSLVTIVIPTYNCEQFLQEAIESAINQTIECEVIVVDDGSTDDTRKLCDKYPIKYVHQENAGLPSARNTGISLSKGKYIICLDSDDILMPDYADRCLEKMRDNTGLIRTSLQHFGDLDVVLTPSPFIQKNDWLVNNQAFGPSMFQKKVWEAVGGYDENMIHGYEDWDFWLRIVWSGYDIETVVDYVGFLYRKHGETMISASMKKDAELKEYIRSKHEDMFGNPVIR